MCKRNRLKNKKVYQDTFVKFLLCDAAEHTNRLNCELIDVKVNSYGKVN